MSEEKTKTADTEADVQVDEDLIQEEILTGHYEICYIISASYTSDEVKPITEKVIKKIKDNEGQVTFEEELGKLKFAYPIDNLSHGYYQVVEFNLPKNNLQKLDRQLKLNKEVLRYIIVKKKIKTKEELTKEKELQDKLAKKKEQDIEKIKAEKEEVKEKPKKEKTKEKMSLEDLDKKLDEILDTDEIM